MTTSLQREEALFSALTALPAAERDHYLARACDDDPALRQRLESLLEVMDRASDADSLAAIRTLDVNDVDSDFHHIGPYRLIREIGEGGCGVVYLAEQTEPLRRDVAIKIIKIGMDTKAVVARFESERQMLAMMDHPSIAKVYDAGSTPRGRPYFVMELVRGVRITDYCRDCRLTPRERVQLFVQVCHAIQHAHTKGVIHRDIKPSNILVTLHGGVPLVKVIDFGVARATQGLTDADTQFTAFEQFVGTPAYMSPEQTARGRAHVGAPSDIYSLGVLLYELLTGRMPFDATGPATAEIIREREPARPSQALRVLPAEQAAQFARTARRSIPTLVKDLRGDLDSIVMRCLEKDPARRYASVHELATDLDHHLRSEPISARPQSLRYSLAKFARRHRAATIAFASSIVMLLGATGVSSWLAIRATNAEQRSRDEAASRQEVIDFLRDDLLAQAGPDEQPDPDVKLRTVLDRAAAKVQERFENRPLVEAAIRHTLGTTYDALGEYATARSHFERTLALRREHLGENDPETLRSMAYLVSILIADSQYVAAEPIAEDALRRYTQVLGAEHPDTIAHAANIALLYYYRGKFAEMEKLLVSLLATEQRVHGPEHRETLIAMNNLAIAYRNQGKFEQAAKMHERELAICRRKFGPEHPDTLTSMNNLANVNSDFGRFEAALQLNREALDIARRTSGENHPEVLILRHNLATNYRELGRYEEAERWQRETVERTRAALGPAHANTIKTEGMLAMIYRDRGRLAEAAALQESVLARSRAQFGEDDPTTLFTTEYLAQIYQEQGKTDAAERLLRDLHARAQRVFGTDQTYTLEFTDQLASVLIDRREFAEAITLLRQSIEQRRTKTPNHWRMLAAESLLGTALQRSSHFDEAEQWLTRAYEGLLAARLPAFETRIANRTSASIVALYTAWNKPVELTQWRARLSRASDAATRISQTAAD